MNHGWGGNSQTTNSKSQTLAVQTSLSIEPSSVDKHKNVGQQIHTHIWRKRSKVQSYVLVAGLKSCNRPVLNSFSFVNIFNRQSSVHFSRGYISQDFPWSLVRLHKGACPLFPMKNAQCSNALNWAGSVRLAGIQWKDIRTVQREVCWVWPLPLWNSSVVQSCWFMWFTIWRNRDGFLPSGTGISSYAYLNHGARIPNRRFTLHV